MGGTAWHGASWFCGLGELAVFVWFCVGLRNSSSNTQSDLVGVGLRDGRVRLSELG